MEASPHTPDEPMTAEEFMLLRDGDEWHVELVEGFVVRSPRPYAVHGAVQVEIAARIVAVVRERELGHVVAESGFVLARDPDTVRGPDVAFFSTSRAPGGLPDGFVEGAPDLAVEVVSRHDTMSGLRSKAAEYLEAGCREVWVVEPVSRTVEVHRPGETPRLLGGSDTLDGGDLLPGFRVRVGELFPPFS